MDEKFGVFSNGNNSKSDCYQIVHNNLNLNLLHEITNSKNLNKYHYFIEFKSCNQISSMNLY